MNDSHEARIFGGLIAVSILGAVVLMLHHPTSLHGPDDGLLLGDWSNSFVHGAMVVVLLTLRFAFSGWARLLGRRHASVRAGAMAFDSGMAAFVAAAVINGFATGEIAAAGANPDAVRLQLMTLGAVNHAFANLGMGLVAAAMALWAVRMIRAERLTRTAGGLGLAVAGLALGWAVVGHDAFGLYPAMIATILFSVWSTLVAARMIRGESAGDRA